MPNDKEYIARYNRENTKLITLRVQNTENDSFSQLCESIGIGKQAYLKKLVNEDCVRRGLPLVFSGNTDRGANMEDVEIPQSYIDAIEFARQNGINRTTMIHRLRAGKYPSAIHAGAKWFVDPRDLSASGAAPEKE